MTRMRVGEALIRLLERYGVDLVFGIPGVHTVELYRALEASPIRHVTPRHEQGAAFMADGYARVTGRPGVCLLITGPGLTNAVTAAAQARADSVPMLIVSGVNARPSLGRQEGHLHELPDQAALARTVFLDTHTLLEPERLGEAVQAAFKRMTGGRPGPVHLEIPTDVMALEIAFSDLVSRDASRDVAVVDEADIAEAVRMCEAATSPLILVGGGAIGAAGSVRKLAAVLDAPVVMSVNARGIMAGHPLNVPASGTLKTVREAITAADLVLAIGTELGPTDYDMYDRSPLPALSNVIRVDVDQEQFGKRADRGLTVQADADRFAAALAGRLSPKERAGADRARALRDAAYGELSANDRAHLDLLQAIWRAMPEAIMVGDSTQLVYAGNLMIDPPRPGAWFNSATGFGTLGYAAPAAIGAALGQPGRPVVCLIGDGGLQFSLAELGSAVEAGADVVFLVWNNRGYREIELSMIAAGIEPIGVKPISPDFAKIAEAYGLPARRVTDLGELADAVAASPRPGLIEYLVPGG